MNIQQLIRICLRWGVIAGVLTTILMITTYYVAVHPFMIAPFLDFRILLFGVFIFFGLKEFRDYYQGGQLYFWQGVIGSMFLVFIASLISAVGLHIFGLLVPAFRTDFITALTAYLKTFPPEVINQIGKETFESNLSALPSTNLLDMTGSYFGKGLVVGTPVAFILSVILRRTT